MFASENKQDPSAPRLRLGLEEGTDTPAETKESILDSQRTGYLDQVIHDMSCWNWVAPVGGGANAEGDPLSGRYKLKKAVIAALKLNELKLDTQSAEYKRLSELIQNIQHEEEKTTAGSDVTDFKKINLEIAKKKREIDTNKTRKRRDELKHHIKYNKNEIQEIDSELDLKMSDADREKLLSYRQGLIEELAQLEKQLQPIDTTAHSTTDASEDKEAELKRIVVESRAQLNADGQTLKDLEDELQRLKERRVQIERHVLDAEAEFNQVLSSLGSAQPKLKQFEIIDSLKDTLVFFKKETNIAKNISEVFAGKFSRAITAKDKSKPLFAEVQFATPDGEKDKSKPKEVYIASVGIPNFEDLFVDAYHAYNFNPALRPIRRKFSKIPEARPKNAGSINKHVMHSVTSSGRYEGTEIFFAMAIFLDDPDIHNANLGAVPKQADIEKLKKGGFPGLTLEQARHEAFTKMQTARIDYAASLGGKIRSLDDEVHYDDILRYFPGLEPTNHVREHPTRLKVSQHFFECLNQLANFDSNALRNLVRDLVGEISTYFDTESLLVFAEHIGLDPEKSSEEDVKDEICEFLYNKFSNRQRSLKKLSFEIQLSLCFERKNPANGKDGLKLASKFGSCNLLKLMSDPANKNKFDDREIFNFRGKWPEHFQEELNAITQDVYSCFTALTEHVHHSLTTEESFANDPIADGAYIEEMQKKIAGNLKTLLINYNANNFGIQNIPERKEIEKLIAAYTNKFGLIQSGMGRNAISALNENIEKLSNKLKDLYDVCHRTTAKATLVERVYNRRASYSSASTAFISWPKEKSRLPKVVEAFGKSVVNVPVNIVKLGTELVPASGAHVFKRATQWCWSAAKDGSNPFSVSGGFLGTVVFGTFWGACKTVHHLGKRITSPMRSTREAYQWGCEKGGKWFGRQCATLGLDAVLSLPLNIVKLGTEYIPAGGAFVFNKMRKWFWRKAKDTDNNGFTRTVCAVVAAVGGVLEGTFKATHAIGKRITSPVRSCKEAYEWGEKRGGKPLGYLCAAGSAIVSVGGIVGLSIAAAPALPWVGAKLGLSSIASSVTNLPLVGPALAKVGGWLGSALGSASSYILSPIQSLGNFGSFSYLGTSLTAEMTAKAIVVGASASASAGLLGGIKDRVMNWWNSKNSEKTVPTASMKTPLVAEQKVEPAAEAEVKEQKELVSRAAPSISHAPIMVIKDPSSSGMRSIAGRLAEESQGATVREILSAQIDQQPDTHVPPSPESPRSRVDSAPTNQADEEKRQEHEARRLIQTSSTP